jgi:hypothetical protein
MADDRHNHWTQSIRAQAVMTLPNGGTVTMSGTPEDSFEKAVRKLEQTHEQYLASGGWGGGR